MSSVGSSVRFVTLFSCYCNHKVISAMGGKVKKLQESEFSNSLSSTTLPSCLSNDLKEKQNELRLIVSLVERLTTYS